MYHIVVIGNADINSDHSKLVDSADLVIRFNEARNYASGLTGHKCDVLCLANTSHPGRTFSKYKTIKKLHFIKDVIDIWFPHPFDCTAKQFWLKPFNKKKFKKTDYSKFILKENELKQKNILFLNEDLFFEACMDLNIIQPSNLIPSSGYMALKYILKQYGTASVKITVLGFTFTGADGHPWHEEKKCVQAFSQAGLITLLL
ncbi:MAG: glycosyltransferase family 29 protein [Methylobacter sp.]|uniref:Glycosyltransferase family 29 protein n=1 Tax=Candidatus Methylobacter titanis TaxID=3053457 RepID=A0AA43Q3H5_9GAMM|nr:glycosyltransferase family 29 protein [Candidatus Methylobacter titanis]MDI1291199.1 glycosyltransferase family 29 protein [Candidatus Methylobacter titanis]